MMLIIGEKLYSLERFVSSKYQKGDIN